MITYLGHNERDYRCVLGSVYPLDTVIPSSLFATAFISLNVRPGSIVILHDRENRGRRTVTTLKRILPKLQRRGYKIVTLTELYHASSRGREK
jgi:peptidoglycan/xylan/chitin deacetylase (PgdA/CDA1 family)